MAGNRTRVNCLEGSYAHHYTTIAAEGEDCTAKSAVYVKCKTSTGRGGIVEGRKREVHQEEKRRIEFDIPVTNSNIMIDYRSYTAKN